MCGKVVLNIVHCAFGILHCRYAKPVRYIAPAARNKIMGDQNDLKNVIYTIGLEVSKIF